jgi:hypothetical protein
MVIDHTMERLTKPSTTKVLRISIAIETKRSAANTKHSPKLPSPIIGNKDMTSTTYSQTVERFAKRWIKKVPT